MPSTIKKRLKYTKQMNDITAAILAQDSEQNEGTFDLCTDNRLKEDPEMAVLLQAEEHGLLTSAQQDLLDSRRESLRAVLVELYREWPLPFVRRLP